MTKMKIIINDTANLPLQRQIFEQVRAKILSGELFASYELPSIRAFARENQVSVITVQKAYQLLEMEGLIYSRRGKGFFVSALESNDKISLSEKSFVESLKPLIQKAFNEGLDKNKLRNIINLLIDEKQL